MFQGEVEVSYCTALKDGDAVVAFRVPGGGAKLGIKAGQKLTLVLMPPQAKQRRPGVQTKLAALAGRWCRDEAFQRWLAATFPEDHTVCAHASPSLDVKESDRAREIAAALVRRVCEVDSRTEFDSDREAADRFGRLIRMPYHDYLEAPRPQVHEKVPA